MPFKRTLRYGIVAAAMSTLLLNSGRTNSDVYPANKITLIVAFAPGGVADTLARLIGQGLSERLRQSVVVENRGGAGGNIAAAAVARAMPDGYTLLATTTALAINDALFDNKQFSSSDFKTIAIAASSPEAVATNPDNPANNVAEFIKAVNGRTINFGSAGTGTGSHVEAEYFFRFLAKAPAQHIPFQGGAPAANAAIGKQIDLLAGTLGGGVAALISAGKLKGLAVAADKRAAVAPNTPTYAEQGFPGFTAASWVGLFAPAKTDPQIIVSLNAAINDILKDSEIQTKLITIGFDPIVRSQPEADAMFRQEVEKWGGMVKALNMSVK